MGTICSSYEALECRASALDLKPWCASGAERVPEKFGVFWGCPLKGQCLVALCHHRVQSCTACNSSLLQHCYSAAVGADCSGEAGPGDGPAQQLQGGLWEVQDQRGRGLRGWGLPARPGTNPTPPAPPFPDPACPSLPLPVRPATHNVMYRTAQDSYRTGQDSAVQCITVNNSTMCSFLACSRWWCGPLREGGARPRRWTPLS